MALPIFRVSYRVNGRRTEETISAYSSFDAKKILEAKYPSTKIVIISTKRAAKSL